MTRAKTLIRSLALALVVAALAAGCSIGDSEQADPPATTAEAAPTSSELKLVVFERTYSECASTDFDLLVGKYKVADRTRPGVASAVALAWIDYLKAGQDALPDGRAGCLQGFEER